MTLDLTMLQVFNMLQGCFKWTTYAEELTNGFSLVRVIESQAIAQCLQWLCLEILCRPQRYAKQVGPMWGGRVWIELKSPQKS